MGSLSIAHWLVVLVIVMLVFGTKKLGSIGGDLGKAIKGFKDGVNGAEHANTASGDSVSPQLNSAQQSAHKKDINAV